jgi:CrcB protein
VNKIILLVLGGSIGTLCRYYGAGWAQARWGDWLPFGTFFVNMVGCLILGLLLGFFESRYQSLVQVPVELRLLLITGFLGALTTFSSYELEALLYIRQGAWERALLYLMGSIVLGLGVMLGGLKLSQWLCSR